MKSRSFGWDIMFLGALVFYVHAVHEGIPPIPTLIFAAVMAIGYVGGRR